MLKRLSWLLFKTLLVTAISSLVVLLPAQSMKSGGGTFIKSKAYALTEPIKTPRLKHVEAVSELETPLHTLMPFGTYSSSFASLNCTWGVASRLPVSWSGNANQWAGNALLAGYTVSSVPRVGSIAVSQTDSYLGHVGIVVSLSPLTVWEENYNGLGVTDTRPANAGEFQNFIYF